MRVVIDANILISFLLTHGPTISEILRRWKNHQFTLLTSEEILVEIKQTIERFVMGNLIESEEAESLIRRVEQESEISTSLSTVTVSSNKKDNRYLECAKDGNADLLVTGDKKHLLRIKKFGKTRVISPKEFVRIFE